MNATAELCNLIRTANDPVEALIKAAAIIQDLYLSELNAKQGSEHPRTEMKTA